MEGGGGGEAPEPADRGGAALPRRVVPQVRRRQRGYYIGGAGLDDDGYFAFDPEQDDGRAGEHRGYFAPAPEQNYGDEGRFVGEDLAALVEPIHLRVPRPGGSPGRGGNLPVARGAAPPPILEDALGRGNGPEDDIARDRGGHQHEEANAVAAVARGGQAIINVPAGGAGQGQRHGANHRPRLEAEQNLVPLRANRNHLDGKGNRLMNLEKRHRTGNELADAKNEDLLDLIACLEELKKEIDGAHREENKYAAKQMSKAYKGALAKAKKCQRDVARAGGIPRPIPAKLMVLPSL